MRDVHALFDDLIGAVPALAVVRREHLADNGEIFPHLLMADMLRWLAEAALRSGGEPDVRAALAVLETHLTSGSDDAQEVIALSFLEHLGLGENERGERVLREWLGPGLRAELDRMEAWTPDPEDLRQFEWPEGWLREPTDDRNPESSA